MAEEEGSYIGKYVLYQHNETNATIVLYAVFGTIGVLFVWAP